MQYKEIWSASNETVKHIKKLQANRGYRESCRQFVLEGERAVLDAIRHGVDINLIIADTNYNSNEFPQIEDAIFYSTDTRLFSQLSDTKTPQGILAVVSMPNHNINMLLNKSNPFIIICDGVSDPGNLGTIIRTADAAGAHGILLSKGCVDIYNPKTVRSTMASLFNIPILTGDTTSNYIQMAKHAGIKIIAGVPNSNNTHYDIDYTCPTALLIGNEAHGINPDALASSDYSVSIPMIGKAESLNVAVAAGILMYEVVRKRLK